MHESSPSRRATSASISLSKRLRQDREIFVQSARVGVREAGNLESAERTSSSVRPTCCAARMKARRLKTLRS